MQNWLKNMHLMEFVPAQTMDDLFELSVSHYSEVRSYAQEVTTKILSR